MIRCYFAKISQKRYILHWFQYRNSYFEHPSVSGNGARSAKMACCYKEYIISLRVQHCGFERCETNSIPMSPETRAIWIPFIHRTRERTGVCGMTVKRTRLMLLYCTPGYAGTSLVRFAVILHIPACSCYMIGHMYSRTNSDEAQLFALSYRTTCLLRSHTRACF